MSLVHWDADHPVAYPSYRCPFCSREFYSGGPALHAAGCPVTGYRDCDVVIVPKMIERLARLADERTDPISGLSVGEVRKIAAAAIEKLEGRKR
jgi:hypothetical protein